MIKQIKYFQAVVKCKSFTKAAEQCYISQSAISQQIQSLEQNLGVTLLKRRNRKISLTPAGEYFYKKSLVLTSDFDKLCSETAKISNNQVKRLRIGYLKTYGLQELQDAIADFSEKFPEVEITIISGNHEDLYHLNQRSEADLTLNDQRRAFSEDYVNFILTTNKCYIEISNRSQFAKFDSITMKDLKNKSCIVIASKSQQENEREFYRSNFGFEGDFIFAENIEEARVLVAGNRGFMLVESSGNSSIFRSTIARIPLYSNNNQIKRNYCAFWKIDESNFYIEEFANILKSKFV